MTASLLTSCNRCEAEGVKVISDPIFGTVAPNTWQQFPSTSVSWMQNWVVDCSVLQPSCITPIQTLCPSLRSKNDQEQLVKA